MYREPWNDDVYSCYNHFFTKRYIARRKRVDALELDWLDIEGMYRSPEVVILTREEILEKSNWSEEEVKLLFADTRFPMTEYARKQIVEVHALIQFFARKALVKARQIQEEEDRALSFAQLHV